LDKEIKKKEEQVKQLIGEYNSKNNTKLDLNEMTDIISNSLDYDNDNISNTNE